MSLLKLGSLGPAVERLQKALSPAPYVGKIDGDFGPKTQIAVKMHQADVGVASTGEVDLTWVELFERPAANGNVSPPTPKPVPALPALFPDLAKMTHEEFRAWMIDRRSNHHPTVRGADGKPQFYTPLKRTWLETTATCLHQTACDMGLNPERYDTISVHFVVLRNGKIVWTCDLDRVLYGGNGWNNRSVQIEVNSLLSGLEDDPSTAVDEALRTTWDDPTTPHRETPQNLTPEAAASLERLCVWIDEEIRRQGGKHSFIVSHRQSSGSRQNDPGQTIWRIAVKLHKLLGLSDGGVGFHIGDGRPNPEKWDDRAKGIPY